MILSHLKRFRKNVTPILDRINTEYMEASVVSSNNRENRINSFERNGFIENTVIPGFSLPNMSSTSNTNELSNLHVLENQLHSSSNLNHGNTSTNTYHSISQE